MSKYKVGDKVLLQGVVTEQHYRNYDFNYDYIIELDGGEHICVDAIAIKDTSKTYADGLNDAWELARKICGCGKGSIDGKTLAGIFGSYIHSGLLLDDFTYQEALAKIEAYEKSHIEVGDVVEFEAGTIAVVTRIIEEYIYVCFEDGTNMGFEKDEYVFKKTGRHIDIEHLLEQIRG